MAGTTPFGQSLVLAAMIAIALVLGACGGLSTPGHGDDAQVRAPTTETKSKRATATTSSGPTFRSRALTATPDARPESGVITGVDRFGFDFAYDPRTWKDVDIEVDLSADAKVVRERGGRLVQVQREDLTRGQRVEVWFLNVYTSYPGQGESDLIVMKDSPPLKLNAR